MINDGFFWKQQERLKVLNIVSVKNKWVELNEIRNSSAFFQTAFSFDQPIVFFFSFSIHLDPRNQVTTLATKVSISNKKIWY